ncbi:Dimethylallyltranstransferase [Arthrobotrys entomopaga]|nr:Dimethylallyltranstransferase [Arthrobotrys entomopaga]
MTDRHRTLKVENLMTLLGRFFQIRDDYQNLKSTDYAAQKGALSDLDEGKYSFILLHALSHSDSSSSTQLHSLLKLRSRSATQTLSPEQKRLVMRCITKAGSIEYTHKVLEELQDKINEELGVIERSDIAGGEENWIIRTIMARLKLADVTVRSMIK